MIWHDDGLEIFAAEGAALPAGGETGAVEHRGARIWHVSYGTGAPVILLHGGLGHSGNFAHQVPALVGTGYRAVLIDSRGHGHSTRDGQPFSYDLMASDVLAVMDALKIGRAPIVGWSDGACIGLAMSRMAPERVSGVLFFACNVDDSGTKPFEFTRMLGNCIGRHQADYAALSTTPDDFQAFSDAVGLMQRTQPNYSAADLAAISVPVTVVQSEHDEFIKPEHAAYIARTIPGAELVELKEVSHFAPLQRPEVFNAVVLGFLEKLP
ncbi:MAG: alpha/beta hydrolase family protein [Devosia sp.]|uniref:alpha/beta fold hydrolase n=1 Tax=Devosia sp. TaxID=1871048 RepID=UPI002617262E|nr:alpha/beta hydrolase [Devosia sp.]MDB5527992.1 alpha/beta hydrolase family protein [Devosia sp.]